uniref:Transposase (Putative), gypsy type n=1 Tax=Tanacetum cinerariifolium TaxID=118510 RepID=A0A699H5J2_TANCI|nr:hypothetical protein [Tanacetum cinerariifolium]
MDLTIKLRRETQAQNPVVPIIRYQVPQSSILLRVALCCVCYPTGIVSFYFKSRPLVVRVCYTCCHLAALRIYYANGYQVRFFLLFLYITMITIRDIKSKLNQKALDALCTKYHIPAYVHPVLPGPGENILQSPDGKKDHFFYVDSTAFPLSVSVKSKLSKDPPPKLSRDGFFVFICHSDPTNVWIGERELAEREVGLLKMIEGRTVPLSPPATTAPEDSGDSIGKLFDDADNEHAIEKSDDVLEETIAKDASTVVAEKSLLPNTGGKSLVALRGMVPDGSAIPSRATEPLIAASVAHVSDVGPLDSVSGPNLRTCPPHVRYVVSSDGSRHSGSYFKTSSFVRSPAADALVVTVVVTTIVDTHVAAGSKAKDVSKDFENIGDSTSAGGVDADAANISRLKKTSTSSDSFYASQSLDTETTHRLCSKFNVGAARQVCLGVEVRIRAEHTVERKCELKDKCAEHTTLLSEKDAEIAHLKSLLSLKETEAVEVISLRSQLSVMETADTAMSTELRDLKEQNFALEGERSALSQRVITLESVTTYKESELASLSSQVSKLTTDLSSFQLSRDELNSKAASLESERDCVVAQALGWAIGCAVNKGIQGGFKAGINHGKVGKYLSVVEAYDPFTEEKYVNVINALGTVDFSMLSQLESKNDSSIVDLMDSLCLEGALAKIPRFREEDKEKRLSLTDVMNPFIEPLSSKSLTGEASSFAAPITTISKTFASSAVIPPSPVVNDQVLGARPHSEDPPVVTFEKEELSTSPE